MKKALISGIFALLFLGSLFAQKLNDNSLPPFPPEPTEVRYYVGEAITHHHGENMKGTAYLWVEKIQSKNLFRLRYAICYDGKNVCIATTYPPEWIEGEVRDGVWVINKDLYGGVDDIAARLGTKKGHIKIEGWSSTIIMNLELPHIPTPE